MLVASVGYAAAVDMGLASARAQEPAEPLTFGTLEPLVRFMQETPTERLLPGLVARLRAGTDLRTLTAAAALANARTFGGEDYVGFHTMMALAPACRMAAELPEPLRPLPVLKVLYRNNQRLQEVAGRKAEVLRPVQPIAGDGQPGGGQRLRDAVRRKDVDLAERTFAGLTQGSADSAFNDLLWAVQDNTEVHRVVLPYRAWDLLDLIGEAHAHTLLRQSVRYCVKSERDWRHTAETDEPRTLLEKLLDEHQLLGQPEGTRTADDAWVEQMSRTIFASSPAAAAAAAAGALAEGMTYAALGDFAGGQPVDPARRRPHSAGRPREQAGRECPRRLDWRSRLRFGERLAEHGPGVQPPQRRGLSDPGRVSGGPGPSRPRR
jgi:hypothetical protein